MAKGLSGLSDEELARQALRSILADSEAPAAAKASAARTLAEMSGALGKGARPTGSDLSPFEMTRDELNAELHGLTAPKP